MRRYDRTPKQRLQRIGNFKELGYDDEPGAPSLVAARGKRGPADKAEVVRYLRAGALFIASPGLDTDVFDRRKHTDGPSILTDGTYSWPQQLAYYVEHYDIELPAAFEAHMRAHSWQVPEDIDVSRFESH